MLKIKKLKNSYMKLKSNYIYKISEEEKLEEYMIKLIDEVESIPENERVYYTEEEFWRLVEKREIEQYGHTI